nr:RNA-directed DNA polymerase, eukaryota [Tanacetum cinerariifolium]
EGESVILGDFNEVRSEYERFGTSFNHLSANTFNHFISMGGLIDLPLEAYSYIWSHKSASKMCKLDRFLVSEEKFQALKVAIKRWCKEDKQRSNASKSSIQSRLADLDKLFDQGKGSQGLVNERSMLLKELQAFNASFLLDMAQKAKVRWSIEGNKNSKYFHGIINQKRSQLAIRGVLVKASYQNEYLERIVTYDEIKRAVWDCGSNKSPGPDGFTFEFYRRYWKLTDQDVVNAVFEFFSSGTFPRGCKSLFITLIPKSQDAKVIKDFRPISLIGSVYKIAAKILANRLSLVISDLISDVQYAFLANRQILYGPFILNELISWRAPHGGVEEEQLQLFVDKVAPVDTLSYDDALLPKVGAPTRWVSVVPIKINVFAWRVSLDRLPTRINLSFRGIGIPSILCLIRSCAGESSSHLLFSCNVARQLLLKVARWWELDIKECMSYTDWLSWFTALHLSKGIKRMLEGVFYVMWWMIWKFCNQVLFGSSRPRLELLFDEIVLW